MKVVYATPESIEDAVQLLADHVNSKHDFNVQAYLNGKPTRSQKGRLRSEIGTATNSDVLLHYQLVGLSGDRTRPVWSVQIMSAAPKI